MIGKVTTRGDLEDASYISVPTGYSSYCNALAIVPDVENIVAVGEIYNSGGKTTASSALIVLASDTLSKLAVVAWTY